MSGLQKRLQQAMDAAGISQSELARRIGIKQASVHSLLNSNSDRTKYILDIAQALSVRPQWLQWGSGQMSSGDAAAGPMPTVPDTPPSYTGEMSAEIIPIRGEEYASIARYDARLSAGPGSILEGDPEPLGYHMVESEWLRALTRARPEHLAIVMVDGDSMEPTLSDRDWVLIDKTQRSVGRQGVYAIRVGEQVWVKRLQPILSAQVIRIHSDNERYDSEDVTEDLIQVIGRVISIVARRV